METLDRVALMRKTMPDLRHIIRRLGGDSPQTEGKESLVNRILMFAPQKWQQEKPKIRPEITPITEEQLHEALTPYLLRGLELEIKHGSWFIAIGPRKDSGSLKMPLDAIVRCAKYLMPKEM